MSKWTCPECGGTWDAIEMNKVGKKIFDIFDDVKICSRCCQMRLANQRIAELEEDRGDFRTICRDSQAQLGEAGFPNFVPDERDLGTPITLHEQIGAALNRIAELEAELNSCVKVLEQVDFTSGCNGQKCVSGHIKTLINIVKELEAVQWHDASEPPEDVFDEVILFLEAVYYKRTFAEKIRYVTTGSFVSAQESEHIIILGWKKMPPLPERSEA